MLSADYLTVPAEEIRTLSSVMTMVGGKIVYAADAFKELDAPLPPASPSWSPVGAFASPATRAAATESTPVHARDCHAGCTNHCGLHGHDHGIAWNKPIPVQDLKSFWGALGCSCFAV